MSTGKGTDQEYLLNEQYKDASNLRSRIHLHRQYSTNTYGWIRWVFDYVKLSPPDARVLEIGCGPCDLWLQNLERIPQGWEIFLSDLSPGMLEKGQDLLYDRAQRFIFQEFDVQEIPHEDNSLDTVIANHMLYHVPDLDKGLREIRRVLKPTGRLFAATNGASHMAELRSLRTKFFAHLEKLDSEDLDSKNLNSEESAANAPSALNEDASVDTGEENIEEQWGLAFNLKNGEELLRAYYTQVNLRHYVDSLRIKSARPLYDYMMSDRIHSVEPQLGSAFREFLQSELDASGGVITITKETGMFQAWDEDLPSPEAKHSFSVIADDPNVVLAEAPRQINLGDEEDDDETADENDESTQVKNLQLQERS